MAALLTPVLVIWALSILSQLVLFMVLLRSSNYRKLPLLTVYVALNLCQAAFIIFLRSAAGSAAHLPLSLSWLSEAVTLLFQAFAATEALRLILAPYRGVWGLGWRVLGLVASVLLAYVAKHAAGNYRWLLLEADRGYHLIFATALVACFLVVRYYSIQIPTAYKILLAGFCFYSCSMVLINTVFQLVWHRGYDNYETIWQFASIFAFVVVQVMWAVALRVPLPADDRESSLPSDDLYRRISPQIDERLRLLDEKLARLWKWEAPSR